METSKNPNYSGDGGGEISSSSSFMSAAADDDDHFAAAISMLKELTVRAESTIKSIFSFFNLSSSLSSSLCVCPYDTRHGVPPESLFRHSLICSSSPGASLPFPDDLLRLLQSLRYPNSIKSHHPFTDYSLLRDASSFSSSSDDLCFSLDDDRENNDGGGSVHNANNFFYKGCPGVVSFCSLRRPPDSTTNKTFLLPFILSAECEASNFITHQDDDVHVDGEIKEEVSPILSGGKILPSEFWALSREIEAWGTDGDDDYPATYSYIALRAASSLDRSGSEEERGLKRWIISNSPRFGIVMDSAMTDHVFILLRLCLKAIRTEALCHLKSLQSNNISLSLNLKDASFQCPKLVGSLAWLASQLSVLYGEANAKAFTVGMLKQSLFCVGLKSMLFKLGQASRGQADCGSTSYSAGGGGCEFVQSISAGRLQVEKSTNDCDIGRVSVNQIAAAVAALHERFYLEERIKGIRFPQCLPKSQLVTEYLYTSTRACEIRKNRPNYRFVSEHDWFLWQRANNQDSGKAKTREELLAEERDYKRRRMSYRGKKVKRNPTEVLRDIIEEHMDEIVRAGGMGYNVKSTAGVDVFPNHRNSNDRTANIHEVVYDISETKLDFPGYEEPLHLYSNDGSEITKDPQYLSKELILKYSEHQDPKKSKDRGKNRGFKLPPIHGNCANLRGQFTHLSEQDKTGTDVIRFQRNGSADNPRFKDHVSKSSSNAVHGITNQGYKHMPETISRGRTKSFRSKSTAATGFEDRYDPSVSYDEC